MSEPSIGDWQSVFELYCGVTIGFSGLAAFFGDPISDELKRFAYLKDAVNDAIGTAQDQGKVKRLGAIKARIDGDEVQSSLRDLQDSMPNKATVHPKIAFALAIVGLVLLFASAAFATWTNSQLVNILAVVAGGMYVILAAVLLDYVRKMYAKVWQLQSIRKQVERDYRIEAFT